MKETSICVVDETRTVVKDRESRDAAGAFS